jgi:hypothetical protein
VVGAERCAVVVAAVVVIALDETPVSGCTGNLLQDGRIIGHRTREDRKLVKRRKDEYTKSHQSVCVQDTG